MPGPPYTNSWQKFILQTQLLDQVSVYLAMSTHSICYIPSNGLVSYTHILFRRLGIISVAHTLTLILKEEGEERNRESLRVFQVDRNFFGFKRQRNSSICDFCENSKCVPKQQFESLCSDSISCPTGSSGHKTASETSINK